MLLAIIVPVVAVGRSVVATVATALVAGCVGTGGTLATGRCGSLGIVLRSDPRGVLDDAVLAALPVPVIARLPVAAGLAGRADDGRPPGLKDAYGKACMAALHTLARNLGRVA